MVKCYNCGKPAMFSVGPNDKRVFLCLDCNLKLVQLTAMKNAELEKIMNYLADQIELSTGIPGIIPRFPQPETKIIQTRDVILNNIHVSNSTIGILNTGNLEIVDSAITALKQDPTTQKISMAITKLANAIAQTNDLTKEKKNEAMEILGVIASEATVPKDQRRSSVVRALISTLPNVIQTSAAVIQIWQEIEPIIKSFFQ